MAKTAIRNISPGPRGVRTVDGDLVMIERGASVELELSAAEKKDAEATGYFEFASSGSKAKGGEVPAGDKPLAKMNKAELLDVAKAENVEVKDGATNKDLVEAIEKARAAATSELEGKTNEELFAIAKDENVDVESDDNKADLVRKITEARQAAS